MSGKDLALYKSNRSNLCLFVSSSFCWSLRTHIDKREIIRISLSVYLPFSMKKLGILDVVCIYLCVSTSRYQKIKGSEVEFYRNREGQNVAIPCCMKSVITRWWTHEFGRWKPE